MFFSSPGVLNCVTRRFANKDFEVSDMDPSVVMVNTFIQIPYLGGWEQVGSGCKVPLVPRLSQ